MSAAGDVWRVSEVGQQGGRLVGVKVGVGLQRGRPGGTVRCEGQRGALKADMVRCCARRGRIERHGVKILGHMQKRSPDFIFDTVDDDTGVGRTDVRRS